MNEKTKHEALLALSEKYYRLHSEILDNNTTYKRIGEIQKELREVSLAFINVKELDTLPRTKRE